MRTSEERTEGGTFSKILDYEFVRKERDSEKLGDQTHSSGCRAPEE